MSPHSAAPITLCYILCRFRRSRCCTRPSRRESLRAQNRSLLHTLLAGDGCSGNAGTLGDLHRLYKERWNGYFSRRLSSSHQYKLVQWRLFLCQTHCAVDINLLTVVLRGSCVRSSSVEKPHPDRDHQLCCTAAVQGLWTLNQLHLSQMLVHLTSQTPF